MTSNLHSKLIYWSCLVWNVLLSCGNPYVWCRFYMTQFSVGRNHVAETLSHINILFIFVAFVIYPSTAFEEMIVIHILPIMEDWKLTCDWKSHLNTEIGISLLSRVVRHCIWGFLSSITIFVQWVVSERSRYITDWAWCDHAPNVLS